MAPTTVDDEADASRQQMLELQRQTHVVNKRKMEIKMERKRLDQESKRLNENVASLVEQFQHQSEKHYRIISHRTAGQVHARLPREIRDAIYKCLVVRRGSIIRVPKGTDNTPGFVYEEDSHYNESIALITLPFKHFLNDNTLGQAVCDELVETFYERNTFRIGDPVYLADFLRHDSFEQRVCPGDVIRKLEIGIQTRLLVDTSHHLSQRDAHGDIGYVAPSEFCAMLTSTLEAFIPQPRRETLDLTIAVHSKTHFVIHDLLEQVGSLVFKLKEAGFRVRVVQRKKSNKKKPRPDGAYEWPGSDWTWVFGGDREAWDEKVRTCTVIPDKEEEDASAEEGE
ncbi:hypothetical protein BDV95DRAFT_575303 [Massariosphaeria phaeospora]|uniref:Uncharacterized protein n=1 Tax=Massariosphaeria phaeospora TaxID=100035 RepID=A0A7C8I7K0_9PLEO|nr:hypothetical protein BDV95DRAFT_575303 [Massariosphaeria phaeospora]